MNGVAQSLCMLSTHKQNSQSSNGAKVPSHASDNVLNLARMTWQRCRGVMLKTMEFTCFDHVCWVIEREVFLKQSDRISLERDWRMSRSWKKVKLSGHGRSWCLIKPSGVRRKRLEGKAPGFAQTSSSLLPLPPSLVAHSCRILYRGMAILPIM